MRKMEKKLAVAMALLASGAAYAQTSVTLFGVVDLGYENVKTNSGRISGLAPSANSSSRLGFRGVEDLGGGYSAGFWLESALSPNSGFGSSGTSQNNQTTTIAAGGLTFNRRSTVSISGPFGELRLGRDYTPSFWNYALYDPFGANSVAGAVGEYSGAASANTFVRASNTLGYFLPAHLGGVFGQAMIATGNRPSNEMQQTRGPAYASPSVNTEKNGRYAGLRVGYAQGPFDTAIAYARTTYAAGTNAASVFGIQTATGDYTDLNWGASYLFGSVKAMAVLFRQKSADVSSASYTGLADNTTKGWSLGADVRVGPGDVLLSYSRATLSGGYAADPRATKWAAGYVYNLSRRTAAYAYYAHVGNSNGAAQTAASFSSGGLGAAASGANNVNGASTGIDIGLRHAF